MLNGSNHSSKVNSKLKASNNQLNKNPGLSVHILYSTIKQNKKIKPNVKNENDKDDVLLIE